MSNVTLTLSADAAAKLEQLLGGSIPAADPVADSEQLAYSTYVARVTRGTPKTLEQWRAGKGPKMTAHPSRPAVADSLATTVAAIARRSDCVAVLNVSGNVVGCYRFQRKSDDADRFTMSGEGMAAAQIMAKLATYVVATGPRFADLDQ